MSLEDIEKIIKTTIEESVRPLQDDIASIKNKITALESDVAAIKNNIANQNYRVDMLAKKSEGPGTFLEALSSTAVTDVKVRYINPAYRE